MKRNDWVDASLYPFRSHFVDVGPGHMHHIDEGAGRVIVMVHGTPTWSFLYRAFIRDLSRDHRVIAVDHLGFGLSDKPEGGSSRPEDHAHNLELLIDRLRLGDITLVVHDVGGPIGLAYAIEHPENVRAVVLFNTWMWSLRGTPSERVSRLMSGSIGRFLYQRLNFSPRVLVRAAVGRSTYGAALLDRDGAWWIGTGEGLVRFPPVARLEALVTTPPLATYTTGDGLAGNDIWHLFEDSRGDIYGGLGPGRCRFEVRAVSATGRVSAEPATVDFTILPPFWRRAWFLAGLIALLTAALFAAHRLRMRRVLDGEAGTPDGARVIDAAGKYVVPGFADVHVHFGSGGREPAETTTTDRILRQFLYYGVTTVFNVGAGRANASSIRALRSQVTSDAVTAPQIYATGSMLTLPGSHPVGTIMSVPDGIDPETYDWSTRGVAIVATIEDARAEVRGNAQAGMDGIKIIVESGPTAFGDDHPQMPPEMISP